MKQRDNPAQTCLHDTVAFSNTTRTVYGKNEQKKKTRTTFDRDGPSVRGRKRFRKQARIVYLRTHDGMFTSNFSDFVIYDGLRI